ncbi:hypothetical protein K2X05_05995 [bacterium]|nr:hypothetical protein [bacterium]
MKNYLLLISISGLLMACGIDDAVKSVNEMPDKMQNMQNEMNKTNESIRLQKVAIAKENLDDPKNAEVLMPIPVGIMGYAKLFAENANLEEITGQIYLYLKEVNEGIYPKLVDETGAEIEYTAQDMANINQSKLHKYTAAQAICGLLPQSVVESLVKEYIYKENRYQKTVFNILMMRYQFLRDVMLNNSILSETTEDVGTLEKAYEYANQMDLIAKLSFINKIQVSVTGFLPPYGDLSEALTTEGAKDTLIELYGKILLRAQTVEKVQMQSFTGDEKLDKQLFADRTQRLNAVLNSTREALGSWKK